MTRNPLSAIYSSSPDRGLQTLLTLWPDVLARVPGAELHVFYGFDTWRKRIPGDAALIDRLAAGRPGVVHHGRVNQAELIAAMRGAGAWLFPTWFSETSCIGAMQAQAAGLNIVTSPIAALVETVGERGVMIPGAPGPLRGDSFELGEPSPEYRAAFVDAAVKALTEQGDREDQSRRALARFDLDELAQEWDAGIRELLDRVTDSVVPRFYVNADDRKAGGDAEESNVG